jgi:hypothetical protein
VNCNNRNVSETFGYNNNICLGGINVLYYCTLYTSKSNQEEETYPYIQALEAVARRLKRVEQGGDEVGLSFRQVGLRNLLSGIHSHISSCVISATMAWYLVKNGSRFHFSHSFKPLLLSQFESWYHGTAFSHRIRYNKRRKKNINNNDSNAESKVNIWLDSSVNNYIFRPAVPNSIFNGICLWERESKYDLQLKKAHFLQESNAVDSHQGCGFSFMTNILGISILFFNSEKTSVSLSYIIATSFQISRCWK